MRTQILEFSFPTSPRLRESGFGRCLKGTQSSALTGALGVRPLPIAPHAQSGGACPCPVFIPPCDLSAPSVLSTALLLKCRCGQRLGSLPPSPHLSGMPRAAPSFLNGPLPTTPETWVSSFSFSPSSHTVYFELRGFASSTVPSSPSLCPVMPQPSPSPRALPAHSCHGN